MTTAKPQRDLARLLSRAEHLATRRLAAVLDTEAEGCSIEQWRVLALLADGHGHTMTELADYALLPAPTATKLTDRLIADNLVYRHPDPTDRRRVLVHLTERGRELHERLVSALAGLQTDLLPFEDLLDHLVDAFDQPATGARARKPTR